MNQALQKLKNKLKKLSNPERAKTHQKFFKTAKGEYGKGMSF